MNAIGMIGACMLRQDPAIQPPPYEATGGQGAESVYPTSASLSVVQGEGVIEGYHPITHDVIHEDSGAFY